MLVVERAARMVNIFVQNFDLCLTQEALCNTQLARRRKGASTKSSLGDRGPSVAVLESRVRAYCISTCSIYLIIIRNFILISLTFIIDNC